MLNREARISDLKVILDERNADISSLRCTLATLDTQHQEHLRQLKREHELQIIKAQTSLNEVDQMHLGHFHQLQAQLSAREVELLTKSQDYQDKLKLKEEHHVIKISEMKCKYESLLQQQQSDFQILKNEYESLEREKKKWESKCIRHEEEIK